MFQSDPTPSSLLFIDEDTNHMEVKQVTKVNQGKIQDQEVSRQPILYSIIFKEVEK